MQVTAIVYGNPQWQPEHGGCLRIWAPPGSHIAASAAAQRAWEARPANRASQQEPDSVATPLTPLDEIASRGGGEADTAAAAAAAAAAREAPDSSCGTSGMEDGGPCVHAHSSAAGESSRQSEASLQICFVEGEAVVDVEPLAGRLVLMLSGAVDHAVLPSQQQRVALTAWCQ